MGVLSGVYGALFVYPLTTSMPLRDLEDCSTSRGCVIEPKSTHRRRLSVASRKKTGPIRVLPQTCAGRQYVRMCVVHQQQPADKLEEAICS